MILRRHCTCSHAGWGPVTSPLNYTKRGSGGTYRMHPGNLFFGSGCLRNLSNEAYLAPVGQRAHSGSKSAIGQTASETAL